MKTAGRVIAIIASVLALLCTYLSFQIGFKWAKFGEFAPPEDPDTYAAIMAEPLDSADIFFLAPAALCLVGTGLGAAGAVLIQRRRRLSGGLFVASAVLCIFTLVGVLASLLFIAGAILAFISAGRQPVTTQPANASFRPRAIAAISITACTFAIIASLLVLFWGIFQISTYHPDETDAFFGLYRSLYTFGVYSLISGILGTTGAALGIVGMNFEKKKRRRAGIFIIIAAVFCVGLFVCILTVLLLLGALNMLWPEKKKQALDIGINQTL